MVFCSAAVLILILAPTAPVSASLAAVSNNPVSVSRSIRGQGGRRKLYEVAEPLVRKKDKYEDEDDEDEDEDDYNWYDPQPTPLPPSPGPTPEPTPAQAIEPDTEEVVFVVVQDDGDDEGEASAASPPPHDDEDNSGSSSFPLKPGSDTSPTVTDPCEAVAQGQVYKTQHAVDIEYYFEVLTDTSIRSRGDIVVTFVESFRQYLAESFVDCSGNSNSRKMDADGSSNIPALGVAAVVDENDSVLHELTCIELSDSDEDKAGSSKEQTEPCIIVMGNMTIYLESYLPSDQVEAWMTQELQSRFARTPNEHHRLLFPVRQLHPVTTPHVLEDEDMGILDVYFIGADVSEYSTNSAAAVFSISGGRGSSSGEMKSVEKAFLSLFLIGMVISTGFFLFRRHQRHEQRKGIPLHKNDDLTVSPTFSKDDEQESNDATEPSSTPHSYYGNNRSSPIDHLRSTSSSLPAYLYDYDEDEDSIASPVNFLVDLARAQEERLQVKPAPPMVRYIRTNEDGSEALEVAPVEVDPSDDTCATAFRTYNIENTVNL